MYGVQANRDARYVRITMLRSETCQAGKPGHSYCHLVLEEEGSVEGTYCVLQVVQASLVSVATFHK